jgi:glycosyltransferase involved in cell wall biosynthesis
MERISIILPTRGRVNMLKELVDSVVKTASDLSRVEIALRVDEDDQGTIDFVNSITSVDHKVFIGSRHGYFAEYFNDAHSVATGDIFMMCNDDLLFRSPGWDLVVDEEFSKYDDKILFLHGREGHHDDNCGDFGFLHKNWVSATRRYACQYFRVYYLDTWWWDIAQRIGRDVYTPKIFTEHMHCKFGKSEVDDIRKYADALRKTIDEPQVWEDTKLLRAAEADKLKRFIRNYGKQV